MWQKKRGKKTRNRCINRKGTGKLICFNPITLLIRLNLNKLYSRIKKPMFLLDEKVGFKSMLFIC